MQSSGWWRENVTEFWRTLGRLCMGWHVVAVTLDLPLDQAVRRSRRFIVWALAVMTAGLVIANPGLLTGSEALLARHLGISAWVWVVWAIVAVTALIFAAVVAYGLLRLYTLIHHVLTLNVFKTRGQRLRLLNVETTLLPLSVPTAAAVALNPHAHLASWVLYAAVLIYGTCTLAYAYDHIFHQTGLRGLLLLIEGTLLTWFVMGAAAIAIAAALGVIVLIIVLILRGFVHSPASPPTDG